MSASTDHERRPLLNDSEREEDLEEQTTSKALPWRPVLVLLLLNAVQPLAYELVFPFISMLHLSSLILVLWKQIST